MRICCLCGVGKAEEVTCQHAACASDDRRAVKVRSAAADVLAVRLIRTPRVHSHGGGQPVTVIECKSLQVTLIVFASVQAILFVDETTFPTNFLTCTNHQSHRHKVCLYLYIMFRKT